MSQAQRRAEVLESAHAQSDGILTADPEMTRVLQTVRQIATTDLPLLVEGETGTGKELIAVQYIVIATALREPSSP
jgi:two-component system C4-dicarboxylate transport response regulator DctD